MAHVRAARALLPRWLARGRGHFLATVSAAGLLSHVTAAPYAITKHAALAFAEWLSIAYGERGITVQALCPQDVRTDMLLAEDSPVGRMLLPAALEPAEVADTVAQALDDGRFSSFRTPRSPGTQSTGRPTVTAGWWPRGGSATRPRPMRRLQISATRQPCRRMLHRLRHTQTRAPQGASTCRKPLSSPPHVRRSGAPSRARWPGCVPTT